jgi:hypothetical protein
MKKEQKEGVVSGAALPQGNPEGTAQQGRPCRGGAPRYLLGEIRQLRDNDLALIHVGLLGSPSGPVGGYVEPAYGDPIHIPQYISSKSSPHSLTPGSTNPFERSSSMHSRLRPLSILRPPA